MIETQPLLQKIEAIFAPGGMRVDKSLFDNFVESDRAEMRQIVNLTEASRVDDLAFVSYTTWHTLSSVTRDRFVETVNPVFYQHVYFVLSKLLRNVEHVFNRENDMTLWVSKGKESFEILIHEVISPSGKIVIKNREVRVHK